MPDNRWDRLFLALSRLAKWASVSNLIFLLSRTASARGIISTSIYLLILTGYDAQYYYLQADMDNLKMVYPTSSIGGVLVQKIDGFQGGETPFVKLSDSCLHIVMETLPVNVRSERWPADIAKQGYIGRSSQSPRTKTKFTWPSRRLIATTANTWTMGAGLNAFSKFTTLVHGR
ncbi:hypothetical protein VTN96DRAFT_2771 [Rasamsonia emersonii]